MPRVIRKSLDVFLDALLGLPSVRLIDFYIDLMLDVDLTLCHRIGLLQRNWKKLGSSCQNCSVWVVRIRVRCSCGDTDIVRRRESWLDSL